MLRHRSHLPIRFYWFKWVRGFAYANEVITSLDPTSAERTLERMRETLAAHAGPNGIWFDAQAGIVAARRRL